MAGIIWTIIGLIYLALTLVSLLVYMCALKNHQWAINVLQKITELTWKMTEKMIAKQIEKHND